MKEENNLPTVFSVTEVHTSIPSTTTSTTLTSLIRVRVTSELEGLVRQAAVKEHQDYAGWVRGVLAREVKRVLGGEEKNNG